MVGPKRSISTEPIELVVVSPRVDAFEAREGGLRGAFSCEEEGPLGYRWRLMEVSRNSLGVRILMPI